MSAVSEVCIMKVQPLIISNHVFNFAARHVKFFVVFCSYLINILFLLLDIILFPLIIVVSFESITSRPTSAQVFCKT